MDLVMLHGRAQEGKDARKLQESWEIALDQTVKGLGLSTPFSRTVFPFYGDELARLVAETDAPLGSGGKARGTGADREVLVTEADIAGEILRARNIPDSQVTAEYDGVLLEKGPLNWPWVLAMFRALERTTLGPWSIQRFTHDVAVYLAYPTVRMAIQECVVSQMGSEECVFVAHSLGTVVAYDLLSSHRNIKVARFVTLGSPLGLQSIKQRLEHIQHPEGVGTWYNAFDERDVVALYPLNSTHFPVQPSIQNEQVTNPRGDDPHKIEGYLSVESVCRKIVSL